ncbi:uncharacterized protein PGTG_20922 [Puccinia graminis f. sp. tritici CRL 75-36-700-3]|uniref:Reverse transcriptase domain-containing protein n=1 Tax=Puccinia graminis f. sp. tritici (strain CRL 75-36-700-3 / race SCCL) TaxID=418459 RepID=H6QPX2_PUCGT|nr:uncharacterized protein PGTG_20922 [Puccinia graminis f. sp. tritici CRL 75-36-700-3]EHS64310.1 hypothetical protein PGTG_20922 [Puccinia graminis f. sp. tritici CRL 75-36-700-3]
MENTQQKITRSKTGTRKEADPASQTATQSATLNLPNAIDQGRSATKGPPSKEVPSKDILPHGGSAAELPSSDAHDSDGEESLDLITKVPQTVKEVIDTTSVPPEASVGDQRSHVWEKIKEAQTAGDAILTKILLAAYKDLDDLADTLTPPKITRSSSALPVLSTVESKTEIATSATVTELEDNLVYAVGTVTSHQDIGFTPYFDENIRKLKAPLPLTIFDREWQKKAIAAHLTIKPSKSSEDKAYRGLAYHDEWTQSHSSWTNNHRSFYITLQDVYNKKLFAEKLRIHKENCDEIADVYGFMTAFRYDMQTRMNAFAHRVPSKDGAAIPDISVKQMVVVEQCYSTVRSFGEASWKDNNYAPGFSHAGYDPDTGLRRPDFHKSASYQSTFNKEKQHQPNHQERRREKRWFNENAQHNTSNKPYGFENKHHYQNFNNNHNQFDYVNYNQHPYNTQHQHPYNTHPYNAPYQNNQGGSNPNRGFVGGSKRFKGANSGFESGGRGGGSKDEQDNNKQVIWPTGVKCEMDVPKWQLALKSAGLLPSLNHVLDGFKFGFDQGIPKHRLGTLRWFTPDNHSSAENSREKIQSSIKEEVSNGRMFGPFTHEEVARKYEFFRTSPLGSVVNADGKMRPINNLSFPKRNSETPSVNSFVNKLDFSTTWDDFKIVSEFFRNSESQYELALFDWAKAYRQIPTLESQWPFLMVKDLNGGLYIDTRITFGGVAGCGSFGIPADAWKKIMEHEFNVVKVFRWVDDNLFVKNLSSLCDMKSITARSVSLGVATSEEKSTMFANEQKFIGFVWNGIEKTVRLTDKKLEERKNQIAVFLEERATFTFNEAEVLAGRLNHVSLLLPQLRCYIRSVYRWMNQWKKRWANREIPQDVRDDLKFWTDTLNNYQHTRLCPLTTPIEIKWVGDASTSYGIGVLVGDNWAQLKLKPGWEQAAPPRSIAWLETVAIRIGILMLQVIKPDLKGNNFIVYTDNTTTQSTLRSRKSKDHHSNLEWKEIQRLLIEMELDITPKRVVSKENTADGLSRGVVAPHTPRNRVIFPIPADLEKFMYHS